MTDPNLFIQRALGHLYEPRPLDDRAQEIRSAIAEFRAAARKLPRTSLVDRTLVAMVANLHCIQRRKGISQ